MACIADRVAGLRFVLTEAAAAHGGPVVIVAQVDASGDDGMLAAIRG